MKALIFAAGLGTRLRPITDNIPKALVRVGTVPMLERIICKMRDAGMEQCIVNAHHFADQIISFLSSKDFGIKTLVSLEEGPQAFETGGGIKHAAPLLGKGRFLVHNVDILSNLDIQSFIQEDRPEGLATLLLSDTPSDRYLLFDNDMRLVGWTNIKTGEIKSPFHNFNPSLYKKYSFCGIHIVSDEVFTLMDTWPECFSIIDFYIKTAAIHPIYGVVATDLNFIDIGSSEKLAEANLLAESIELFE